MLCADVWIPRATGKWRRRCQVTPKQVPGGRNVGCDEGHSRIEQAIRFPESDPRSGPEGRNVTCRSPPLSPCSLSPPALRMRGPAALRRASPNRPCARMSVLSSVVNSLSGTCVTLDHPTRGVPHACRYPRRNIARKWCRHTPGMEMTARHRYEFPRESSRGDHVGSTAIGPRADCDDRVSDISSRDPRGCRLLLPEEVDEGYQGFGR